MPLITGDGGRGLGVQGCASNYTALWQVYGSCKTSLPVIIPKSAQSASEPSQIRNDAEEHAPATGLCSDLPCVAYDVLRARLCADLPCVQTEVTRLMTMIRDHMGGLMDAAGMMKGSAGIVPVPVAIIMSVPDAISGFLTQLYCSRNDGQGAFWDPRRSSQSSRLSG